MDPMGLKHTKVIFHTTSVIPRKFFLVGLLGHVLVLIRRLAHMVSFQVSICVQMQVMQVQGIRVVFWPQSHGFTNASPNPLPPNHAPSFPVDVLIETVS